MKPCFLPKTVEREIKISNMISYTLFIFVGINFLSICYVMFMGDEGFGFLPVFFILFSLFCARYFSMSKEEEASKLDTWSKV